jgi:hypothetical protein
MSSNESASADIAGKWSLVSDSTFEGVGVTNHAVNYMGVAGDYFDFSMKGYVYTKEASSPDTLTYTMISDTKLIISDFGLIINGVPDISTIAGLRANNGSGNTTQVIVIESPFFLTPGGEFWRKVTLSR